VFRNAVVIVNGYIAHENASGYAPFRVDIADFLNYDGKPNLLVVRVDASLGEGWFYEGAGSIAMSGWFRPRHAISRNGAFACGPNRAGKAHPFRFPPMSLIRARRFSFAIG
jgi:hypothetical protein